MDSQYLARLKKKKKKKRKGKWTIVFILPIAGARRRGDTADDLL